MKTTLGKKLKLIYKKINGQVEKTEKINLNELLGPVLKLKILDPACGWGAFLLEALDQLGYFYKKLEKMIDSNRNKIVDYSLKKTYFSTFQLLSHISGIEINPATADLARHLIKIKLELPANYELNNIITGDFIKLVEGEKCKYDLVAGNPPYFSIGGGGKGKTKTGYHHQLKNHNLFKKHFRSQSDIYYYFIMGGIQSLKPGGEISYIAPSYWTENEFADKLREYILLQTSIEELVFFGEKPVFQALDNTSVNIDPLIFRLIKKKKGNNKISVFFPGNFEKKCGTFNLQRYLDDIKNCGCGSKKTEIKPASLGAGKWILGDENNILDFLVKDGRAILPLGDINSGQLKKYPGEYSAFEQQLQGICQIGQGQETGLSEAFVITGKQAEKWSLETELLKPNIKNRQIRKWAIEHEQKFILFLTDEHNINDYPNAKKYLSQFRSRLEKRQRVRTGKRKWYAISIPQNTGLFSQIPKILVPYRASHNRFAIDNTGYFNDGGDVRAIVIKPEWKNRISYHYLLAFLNSRLINYWYRKAGKKKGRIYEYFTNSLARIPVSIPDSETMREIDNKAWQIMKTPGNNAEILNLEKDIDRIIYRIYGLDELQVRIIEENRQ